MSTYVIPPITYRFWKLLIWPSVTSRVKRNMNVPTVEPMRRMIQSIPCRGWGFLQHKFATKRQSAPSPDPSPSPNHRPMRFHIQSGHAACRFSGLVSNLSNKEMPLSNSLILAVKREVSYTKTALATFESRPDVRPSSRTEFRRFQRLEVSESDTDLTMVLGWI